MEAFDKEINTYFEEIGRMQGMDPSFLKLFGVLYLEPHEITMEELSKKTGYSLASISTKIKLFESSGIISRKTRPGSKRAYIYAQKDMVTLMRNSLLAKQENLARQVNEKIPAIINKYEAKMKTPAEKEKMAILKDYCKQMNLMQKMLPRMINIINEESNPKFTRK